MQSSCGLVDFRLGLPRITRRAGRLGELCKGGIASSRGCCRVNSPPQKGGAIIGCCGVQRPVRKDRLWLRERAKAYPVGAVIFAESGISGISPKPSRERWRCTRRLLPAGAARSEKSCFPLDFLQVKAAVKSRFQVSRDSKSRTTKTIAATARSPA